MLPRRGPLPRSLACVLACACIGFLASAGPSAAAGVDAGRRIYQDGIRPSGDPLIAQVAGDVPVLGTQFSCQNCHGRSGMGTAEGNYIVPAIAGPFLFAPSPQPKRPAYDQQSLARALRDGVDAAGRPLDALMPRYRLADDEVAALAAYLAELSAGPSPGVDDKVIRLATVVTDDVAADAWDAVYAVLRTFVEEKNRQTRLESQRFDRGSTPASRLPTIFREWVLDVWTLKGPPEDWPGQLESRYESEPVFALLSGLSNQSWSPIAQFCERQQVPCLFPGTDLPAAAAGDFYTIYFSRGLYLESELIAQHLAASQVPAVVQVFCDVAPARAAARLRALLEPQNVMVADLEFACSDSLPLAKLVSRVAAVPGAAVVIWVRREQLVDLDGSLPAGRLYFSSTLLDRELSEPLLAVPGPVFVAYPYRLPGEPDAALTRFIVWARSRSIEIRYPRLQAEAFFGCLAANDALGHLGRFFLRDYVLDMLDHTQGLAMYLPIHPRPTLGPGQRFLTKGGYVLPVRDGRPDTANAIWILP